MPICAQWIIIKSPGSLLLTVLLSRCFMSFFVMPSRFVTYLHVSMSRLITPGEGEKHFMIAYEEKHAKIKKKYSTLSLKKHP